LETGSKSPFTVKPDTPAALPVRFIRGMARRESPKNEPSCHWEARPPVQPGLEGSCGERRPRPAPHSRALPWCLPSIRSEGGAGRVPGRAMRAGGSHLPSPYLSPLPCLQPSFQRVSFDQPFLSFLSLSRWLGFVPSFLLLIPCCFVTPILLPNPVPLP